MRNTLEQFIKVSHETQKEMNAVTNHIKGVEILFKRGGWPSRSVDTEFGYLKWNSEIKRLTYYNSSTGEDKPVMEHKFIIRKHLVPYIEELMKTALLHKGDPSLMHIGIL